jgi:hypothetical protein
VIASASAEVPPRALVQETGSARTSWKPLPAVAAAVAAAKRNAALPWPLTPPVGSLRGDFYEFPKGCGARQGQTTSRICRLGEPDAEGIMRCPESGWRYQEVESGQLRCLDHAEEHPI